MDDLTGVSPTSESALDPLKKYFGKVWQILAQPHIFFSELSRKIESDLANGGKINIVGPLTFALVTHWIGSAFEYFWNTLLGSSTQEYLDKLMQLAGGESEIHGMERGYWYKETSEIFSTWFMGAGSIVADPFITLFTLFSSAVLVFVAARIFAQGNRGVASLSFNHALIVVCYGLTPSIVNAVPAIGGFVSGLWVIVATVFGAKYVFKTDTGRAILIALFPKLVMISAIAIPFVLFFGMIVKLLAGF